jgi:hypothetical protein
VVVLTVAVGVVVILTAAEAAAAILVVVVVVVVVVKLKNSVALVRERTIQTERPPPVGEVSANFCG